ncbi:hypothetical protein BVRB_2g043910 [Beta vulgaris subsp. vulgaris]|nr:hypothetical protein BVRB_2g043910 [Beta vulgaris subsp. vulgaris]
MAHRIAATVCFWCIILVMRPSSALEEVSRQEQLHLGAYPTETYDLNSAIRVDNVYLVAYRVGGQTQGTFFKELDVKFARSKLFDKKDNQPTLQYDSNYNHIEAVGGSRQGLDLGLQELRKRIVAFYDPKKPVSAAEEARFLLTSIQMVSEAVRFKYIETLVVNNGLSKHFKPDTKMIDLENKWGKISKAVHQSNEQVPNQCVTISPPIDIAGKKWNLVSDIKIDVILLKYKSNDANSRTSTMVASYINKAADIAGGVGDPELAILEDSFV